MRASAADLEWHDLQLQPTATWIPLLPDTKVCVKGNPSQKEAFLAAVKAVRMFLQSQGTFIRS